MKLSANKINCVNLVSVLQLFIILLSCESWPCQFQFQFHAVHSACAHVQILTSQTKHTDTLEMKNATNALLERKEKRKKLQIFKIT